MRCPQCEKRDFASYKGYANHHARMHGDPHPLVDVVGEDWFREQYESKPATSVAERLNISRRPIEAAAESLGIKRTRSEAERLKNERMSAEDRRAQTRAANDARRGLPYLGVNSNGYERIRHGTDDVKHHRLLATLLVDGLDELDGQHVHHDDPVWPGGPDAVNHAANYLENIELLSPSEHVAAHDN